MAKATKKESRRNQKVIELQRYDDYHEKFMIKARTQRELEEAQLLQEKLRQQRVSEMTRQKEIEALMRKREIRRRDLALRKLGQVETLLEKKLNDNI